jgi:plastocyanin
MRRIVMLVAVVAALTAGCGRGQDPALGGAKASGPPKTDLTVVAKDTAFVPTTLTAPAGKELTITFRNEDTISHSFHLFGGSVGDVKTDVKAGPTTDTLKVTLQVASAYNFQCDVHPSVMKGTLVVVKDKPAS